MCEKKQLALFYRKFLEEEEGGEKALIITGGFKIFDSKRVIEFLNEDIVSYSPNIILISIINSKLRRLINRYL